MVAKQSIEKLMHISHGHFVFGTAETDYEHELATDRP